MFSLETPRLGLRPFTEQDFEFLVDLNADPEVARYIGYGVPRTREQSREFLDRLLQGYAEDSLGQLAVFRRDSGELLGRCGIVRLEVEVRPPAGQPPRWYWFRGSAPAGMAVRNEVELGYTFARRNWGHGYATESATAVRDYAFGVLGIPHIASAIARGNDASRNVARKLGLRYAGMITAFDMAFESYRLTRAEWDGGAPATC